jgi:hypothetical protein
MDYTWFCPLMQLNADAITLELRLFMIGLAWVLDGCRRGMLHLQARPDRDFLPLPPSNLPP